MTGHELERLSYPEISKLLVELDLESMEFKISQQLTDGLHENICRFVGELDSQLAEPEGEYMFSPYAHPINTMRIISTKLDHGNLLSLSAVIHVKL